MRFRIVFVGETRLTKYTRYWKTVGMSAANGNLQAQVESVLGALLKAATSELIRLFEGSCGASVLAPDAFFAEPKARFKTADTTHASPSSTSQHSVGVQVDLDLCSPSEVFGKKVSVRHHFLLWSPAGLNFNVGVYLFVCLCILRLLSARKMFTVLHGIHYELLHLHAALLTCTLECVCPSLPPLLPSHGDFLSGSREEELLEVEKNSPAPSHCIPAGEKDHTDPAPSLEEDQVSAGLTRL